MLLVIDIGNTHTVFGLIEKGKVIAHWRNTSTFMRTEDEIGVLLMNYFDHGGFNFSQVDGVCLSSVVPDLSQAYIWMSQKYLKKDALVINSGLKLGMKILYKVPESVGADRLCNAIAGIKKYGKPLIILDFGTATTFDCVDSDGNYAGGVIAPGIETSISALHRRAAKLPRVEMTIPDISLGRTTEESIQIGIMRGTIHLVKGIISDLRETIGSSAKVIATGGLSNVIAQKSDTINVVDPFLNLEGMALIYENNT